MRLLARLSTTLPFLACATLALPSRARAEDAPAPAADAPAAAPAAEAPAPTPAPAAEAPAPVAEAPAPPTSTSGRAAWHPRYGAEIEAHLGVAAFDQFFVGMGAGARVSVPIWHPFSGFDNDLGVGVGVDLVRYGAYKPQDPIGAALRVAATYVPLYAQWNVWLGSRASLFVEPTLLYRYAEYIDSCFVPDGKTCSPTTRFLPTLSAGMRFRLADHFSGTVRVGWPMATLGASWL